MLALELPYEDNRCLNRGKSNGMKGRCRSNRIQVSESLSFFAFSSPSARIVRRHRILSPTWCTVHETVRTWSKRSSLNRQLCRLWSSSKPKDILLSEFIISSQASSHWTSNASKSRRSADSPKPDRGSLKLVKSHRRDAVNQ